MPTVFAPATPLADDRLESALTRVGIRRQRAPGATAAVETMRSK